MFNIDLIHKKKTGAVVKPIVPAVAHSFPDNESCNQVIPEIEQAL